LDYSVSSEGSLAYVPGKSEYRGYNLVQVSRNGTIQRTFRAAPGPYYQPRVSPDGRHVAMDVYEGVPPIAEVWLYDLGADQPIPFTYRTEGDNRHPNWLGSKGLVFQSDREGTRQIFSQSVDGSARERLTNFSPSPSGGLDIYTFPVSLCRDEQLTVVRLVPDAEAWVLHLGDASGQGGKTERLDFPMSADGTPQFSPDCRWLAYVSNESGRREVWVRSFPGLGNRRQISTGGGNEPAWNPDPTKRELFYRNGEDMMAVKISDQGSVEGKVERLFSGSYLAQSSYSRPNYDVFPDGSFLMLKNAAEQEETLTQINIVWGWSEQLKRLVPTATR
jgi:serine/threonine-protein kinase